MQVKTQFLLELFLWASNIGSAAFRRKLLELVPSGTTKEFIRVVDDLDEHSKVIYQEKTKALENGDEVATETVHMGKDILSVLSKCRRYCRISGLRICTLSEGKYDGERS